jgi:hypothetical protein
MQTSPEPSTTAPIGRARWRRRAASAALAVVGLLTLAPGVDAAPTGTSTTPRTWAPADHASLRPGVQTVSESGQCTANFVFTNGADVFLGQAAHCTGTGAATETDGCRAKSLPLGTKVTIEGASEPGVLVYNSWRTMQARGERGSEPCRYNDFALVRIDPADHARVNPTIPYWGGPTGLGTTTKVMEPVYSYGNSSLRLGLRALSPKEGYSLGASPQGWSHLVYTVTPGIPGDSGSAFLDSSGRAVGVLSTMALAPLAASNNVTDLSRAIDYARRHGSLPELVLVRGTERFLPGLLP